MPGCQLKITGKVQGVWYRESARKEAERLGITGWIKNCEDGSVEAVANGPKEALEQFIAWCRKGPMLARVDEVEVLMNDDEQSFESFVVNR